MRLPKILGHVLVTTALATGGLVIAGGTAHATYSQCVDMLAAKGFAPDKTSGPCAEGAKGNVGEWNVEGSCIREIAFGAASAPGDLARAACKVAAVQP
ncbi:hypothetical protein ACVWZD_008954 [Streptomyces sp. TE3672]